MEPERIIDFRKTINPLGCSPKIKSFFSYFENGNQNQLNKYDNRFVNILSGYHGLPENFFLSGNGSTAFLYLFPKVFRPKMVLLMEPVFRNYETGYQKAKFIVFYKNLFSDKTFLLNTDKLFKELKRGYRVFYIPNPTHPTGRLIPKHVLQEIIYFSKNKGVQVILDESAIDYHEEYSMKNEVHTNANLIILRSMSDFFSLPGLRVGYIISHPNTIEKIRVYQPPETKNLLSDQLAAEALKDRTHIRKSLLYLHESRSAFVEKLKRLSFFKIYRGHSNFILTKLKPSARLTSAEICKKLQSKGIHIKSCHNIRGLEDRYFQIAVKKKNENNRLVSELRKLKIP